MNVTWSKRRPRVLRKHLSILYTFVCSLFHYIMNSKSPAKGNAICDKFGPYTLIFAIKYGKVLQILTWSAILHRLKETISVATCNKSIYLYSGLKCLRSNCLNLTKHFILYLQLQFKSR